MKQILILCAILAVAFGSALQKSKAVKKVGEPVAECTTKGQYVKDDYDCATFYECNADLEPVEFHCDPGLCWYEAAFECVWINPDYCVC